MVVASPSSMDAVGQNCKKSSSTLSPELRRQDAYGSYDSDYDWDELNAFN